MFLAQLSDLHISAGPEGERAVRGARAAVARVNALNPAPAAVVVTGDVTNDATPEATELAGELLASLTAPFHVIPGNHDGRDELARVFGELGGAHRQGVVELGDVALVLCDSHVPGSDAGALDEGRLEWIDEALAGLGAIPAVVAIHHPPIVTGITAMDELKLAGIPEFAGVVARHPQVQGVIAGHLHRTITARIGGVPLVVCPSTFAQLDLTFDPGADIVLTDEPQAFALHRVTPEAGLVSHIETVAVPERIY